MYLTYIHINGDPPSALVPPAAATRMHDEEGEDRGQEEPLLITLGVGGLFYRYLETF